MNAIETMVPLAPDCAGAAIRNCTRRFLGAGA